MDERLKIFWEELLTHCRKQNKLEFVYSVEYWGLMWSPWFIHIDDNNLPFSINDLSDGDLQILTANDCIEFVKELALRDPSDIKRELYRIKIKQS